MAMDQIWDLFRMVSRDTQANVASSSRAPNLAASSSATPPGRVQKINDHVYEVSNLSGRSPSLELIFFHGLQLEGSQRPHLHTWFSRDGNDLWLLWILDHFPGARIRTVSYDAHEKMTDEGGRNDMYVTTENLLHDLIGGAQIGQSECPLVLVGHCLGGLVMKQLCVYADSRLSYMSAAQKSVTTKFLKNIKGLFFYATPHLGTRLADMDTLSIKGQLFQDATTLNKEVTRRNEDFRRLCTNHGWKTFAIGENQAMSMGKFKGLIIVPEASARHHMDEFYTVDGNHNDVCRPESPSSSKYSNLLSFVRGIMEAVMGEAKVPVHECQGLPSCAIGLDSRTSDVQKILEGGAILGICGMGGIGKTTLAKKIFNTISKDFEYTCFVDNVKGINVQDLNETVLEHFHQNGTKLDKAVAQWSQLKDKKILLVMDDVDSEEQFKFSPTLKDFKKGSCFILTSRDREVFKFYGDCSIYEVEMLNAEEAEDLFCKNVFGLDPVPDILRKHVMAIVEKCNGLPLTLEVIGHYLRGRTTKVGVWDEIMYKLGKATPLHGNDRVWALLKLSYDGLSMEEQAMFIEAAMIFFERPLDKALIAWGNAETTWENLISRSMVKEIMKVRGHLITGEAIEYKEVWVHEHLRDLAKSVANDDMRPDITFDHGLYGQDLSPVVNKLNANEVLSLRPPHHPGRSTLQLDSLLRLKQLKYLEMDRVNIEDRRMFLKLLFSPIKFEMDNLVVLELSVCVIPKLFVKALGNLTNLRILSLSYLEGLQRLPKNFGNLTQLRRLIIQGFSKLKCLPQSFSELSRLEELSIRDCRELEELGDSFGHLTSLRNLELWKVGIQRLPANFDHLSALETLRIQEVSKLKSLSDDFGQLTALTDLFIAAEELETLPENFHFPKSLQRVRLYCRKLEWLPENFYFLKSLKTLILFCPKLKSLSDGLGQFTALEDLCIYIGAQETLPEIFSFLNSLQNLELTCPILERLPESLGLVTSLRAVTLENCLRLKSLPDSLGKPSSPQPGLLQGHEIDELRRRAGERSEGIRLAVSNCPYLSNSVLGIFGWGHVPSTRYFNRHAWVVHNDVKCDSCEMSPLEGQRYRSSIRSDHNLCHSCFQKSDSDASEYTCIDRPLIPVYEPSRGCDGCGICIPEGPRYMSSTKFDYVLCPDCFQKSGSNASEYASLDPPVFHQGTNCDGCNMYPITGPTPGFERLMHSRRRARDAT